MEVVSYVLCCNLLGKDEVRTSFWYFSSRAQISQRCFVFFFLVYLFFFTIERLKAWTHFQVVDYSFARGKYKSEGKKKKKKAFKII